jgi:hypothetical protein
LLVRAIERSSVSKDGATFTFEVNHRSTRRHRLLFQVGFLKLFDCFRGNLEIVVEEVRAEPVTVEKTEAFVRAPFTEL